MKKPTWERFGRLVVLRNVLWAIAMLAWVWVAQAEVYQWKDKQGHVHFSDTPHQGSEKRQLKPLHSIKNPRFNMANTRLEVPYQDVHGSMMVEARINHVPMRFILDTGASLVVISPQMAKKAHISMDSGAFIMLQTANGLVRAPQVSIEHMQLGRWQQQHIQAAIQVVSSQHDVGLLGMSFLKAYRMSIDHQRHIITLEAK